MACPQSVTLTQPRNHRDAVTASHLAGGKPGLICGTTSQGRDPGPRYRRANVTATATVQIPATGIYRIDPADSSVSFTTRHLFGLGAVKGTFGCSPGK